MDLRGKEENYSGWDEISGFEIAESCKFIRVSDVSDKILQKKKRLLKFISLTAFLKFKNFLH